MNLAWDALGWLLVAPALLSRAFFLARTRVGWLFYYPNVLNDFCSKRLGIPRATFELALAGAGIGAQASAGARWQPLLAVSAVAALQIWQDRAERRILTAVYAHHDRRRSSCSPDQRVPDAVGAVPSPSTHPDLVVNLLGPFVARRPHYDLGTVALGRELSIVLRIGNHSIVPCQVPIVASVAAGPGIEAQMGFAPEVPPLGPGDVFEGSIRIVAHAAAPAGDITILLDHADRQYRIIVCYASVTPGVHLVGARITRYPGACRAAFAWRGDMDHYDTATFQSTQGLEVTLGLAARYRIPQTMFLSTRLTLNAAETREYYEHYGVDRGQNNVAAFVSWMLRQVDLRHSAPYPFESSRPFVLELGNHMHLHYGTDASAAPGNGWRRAAGIGAGRYSWTDGGAGSFEEQRDNATEACRRIQEAFAFTPKSWAMPDSTKDGETPRAVEAAGCDVLSDSDGRHVDNLLFQPPPHHPDSTRAVELTKRYPGDPETIVHAEMIRFWVHRAHRLGIPVVFMCHQHMRQFAGTACARFTEWVLRRVLTDFHGDLFVDTVWGVGNWWRKVLSPKTAVVSMSLADGRVRISNASDETLQAVPVDLVFENRRKATVLVDLPARGSVTVSRSGEVRSA